MEVWFETSLARHRFCTCVWKEWSQSAATSHFLDAQHNVLQNISLQRCSQASQVAATSARNTCGSGAVPRRRLFHYNAHTCLSPLDGCCLKSNVANVVNALHQRTSATRRARAEEFTGSVWTRENPPDCFVLCCWTALHSDPVLQHGAATGPVREAVVARRGWCITRYAAPVCPTRTSEHTGHPSNHPRALSGVYTHSSLRA